MNTADFINKAISLPLAERALLANALLQSINPHEETATCAWLAVAQRRLDEVSSGKVEATAGDSITVYLARPTLPAKQPL